MGSSRKLQGEIDRVLKKVQEGVDIFDSIWNKIYDTENANQKEKFEADLKKEIKKLQRYRDQIKTWIQSSEIKEKKALMDARKLIEREMERFKVCEKETKTKAFSKEGLGQQPKTDPREKAKSESRDWLNNMVSDLESQIDSFEAEMEGLTVKKGKTRPPRLTHLEDSISRHKQHITKLEQILRSLENDGLSPEEVNDVKDFVEDYVDRNQQDFDEFAEVEDLYQSLPLDKLEALEALEAIPVVAPAIIVKEKQVAVAAASGGPALNGTSAKSPVALLGVPVAAATAPAAAAAITQQGSPSLLTPEEVTVEDTSGPVTASVKDLVGRPGSPAEAIPVSLGNLAKEMDTDNLGQRVVTNSGDGSSVREPVGGGNSLDQSPPGLGRYMSAAGAVCSDDVGTPVATESRKAGIVGDERLGSGGLAQQVATPVAGQDRGSVGSGVLSDLDEVSDSVPPSESGMIGSRMFSPSVGGPWRLTTANSFQNPTDLGQFQGRSEITPDQKQKYLQRLQEHQHGQSSSLLTAAAAQLSHLSSPNQKAQALTSAQHQLQVQLQSLQQHEQPQPTLVQPSQPSRSSVLQLQQPSLGLGLHPQQIASSSGHQQEMVHHFVRSPSPKLLRPSHMSEAGSSKDLSELDTGRAGELHPFQSRSADQKISDITSLTQSFQISTSLTEDDSKNADTFDVVVGDPGTLAEFSQLSRDVDFSPGPAIRVEHPAKSPGVIGMRTTLTNSGSKFDSPGISLTSSPTHDQMSNKQALDAAYTDIPLPKDSERPKSYTPRYPATTPASYPQAPAAVVENPALWEKLDTDVLFLAFYYQQGTFQQYLAARQLKKQSWRYHKKYNTWFQRHEEPKIATDEYEQGTYVYFDFHVVPDDFQQGWCQRIKSEFTFEYSYLEDELVL